MNPNMKTVTGRFKKKIKIPKEWEFMTLGGISDIKRGASPRPIADSKYFGDGRGWIRIADVTKSGKYLEKTKQYLSALGESKSVAVNHGDVIMSIAATIGKPIIVKMKACIHDGFVVFTNLDKDMDSEFLYYLLLKTENEFKSLGQHGTQINLNIDLVSNAKFSKPSLPEQQKIASILSNIDELIQKQQQVIEQTQKLMKGQMQKLLTRGIGHSEFKTAQLMPKWNKAEKPDNWDVMKLSDIGEIITGTTPSTSNLEFYGSDHIWATPEDIDYESKFVNDSKTQLTKKGFENAREIPKKSILFVCIGSTIGKVVMAEKKMATNQQINSLVCKEHDPDFVYYQLLFHSKKIKTLGGTTAVPIINKTDFGKYKITIPTDKKEQQKIASILSNLDLLIQQEKQYKEKLEKIKRGLMQQLLTGKTSVKI